MGQEQIDIEQALSMSFQIDFYGVRDRYTFKSEGSRMTSIEKKEAKRSGSMGLGFIIICCL